MLLAPCLNMVKRDQTHAEETAILFPLKLSNQVPNRYEQAGCQTPVCQSIDMIDYSPSLQIKNHTSYFHQVTRYIPPQNR